MQLEGIVSKRRDAPYRSGRSGDWLKTKCANNQEFVVIGYEPSTSAALIRSLLLGYYEDGKLRYAGRVGTGWGDKAERDLRAPARRGRKQATRRSTRFRRRNAGAAVKWVEPQLVVEIDFRGWTGGKLVRQGSFKGVREDKPAKQVVREVDQMPERIEAKQAALRQKPPKRTHTASKPVPARGKTPCRGRRRGAEPSRPRLLGGRRRHQADAGGILHRGLGLDAPARRPAACWRWCAAPTAPAGECFFQKHASAGIDAKHLKLVPETTATSPSRSTSVDGLVSLAQAGVLEIHVRGSTIDHLEEADRLVFDLDPGPGVEWNDVIAAAREVRAAAARAQARKLRQDHRRQGPACGAADPAGAVGRGQGFLPPHRRADGRRHAQTATPRPSRSRRATTASSSTICATAARRPRSRPIRRGRGRARRSPSPLTWEELGSQKAPNAFTVENLPKRLARLRNDPWEDMGRHQAARCPICEQGESAGAKRRAS